MISIETALPALGRRLVGVDIVAERVAVVIVFGVEVKSFYSVYYLAVGLVHGYYLFCADF